MAMLAIQYSMLNGAHRGPVNESGGRDGRCVVYFDDGVSCCVDIR